MLDEPHTTGEWQEIKSFLADTRARYDNRFICISYGLRNKHEWTLTETVEEKKYSQHSRAASTLSLHNQLKALIMIWL